MAEKTMHHAVIGNDTFELVDQSARDDVSDLKNALVDTNNTVSDIIHGDNAGIYTKWEYGTINASGEETLEDRQYYARTTDYYTPSKNETLQAQFVAVLDSAFVFCEFNGNGSINTRRVYWRSNATDVADMQSIPLTYGKKYRFVYMAPNTETLTLTSMRSYLELDIISAIKLMSGEIGEAIANIETMRTADTEIINELNEITDVVYLTNICDNSQLESGFINYENGSVVTSQTYKHSGYIRIEKGVMYMFQGTPNHFAFYDIEKSYVHNSTNNITTFDGGTVRGFSDNLNKYYFTSPTNGFVRVSTLDPSIVFVAIKSASDDTSKVDVSNTAHVYPFIAKTREKVFISAEDGINSFYTKMLTAFNIGDCDVYIGKGNYIYTNALIENIRTAGKRGIPIGNGCRYFFDSGSYVICEYTGQSASDVVDLFCPFDTWRSAGDYELHNLHLVAKNVCYAIHDEAYGLLKPYKHIYNDCYIELDNTSLGSSGNPISKCIGGGLGVYGEIVITNCAFRGTNPSMSTQEMHEVSYHGAADSTFTDSHIVVTGCYFILGTFRTDNLSENTEAPYPRVICSNNSLKNAPIIAETWEKYLWNNVIH